MSDQVIEGLPTDWKLKDGTTLDLSLVPPSPSGPDDPDRPEKMALWERWYWAVYEFRQEHQDACEDNATMQAEEIKRITTFGPKYFTTVWCSIYEERIDAGPSQGEWLPAILFGFQVQIFDWLKRREHGRGAAANGVIRKSRDMGATWMVCFWGLWGFLFKTPFSTKYISRNEDAVDTEGDLDAMLQRIKAHLVDAEGNAPLPRWMLPAGWNKTEHSKLLRITRPGNRNRIRGESTNKRAARGGRSFGLIVDEGAHIDGLRRVLASAQASTSHLIVLSSESVESGEDFVEYADALAAIDPDCVLELDYWLQPYHDETWLMEQKERYGNDEEGFAREVMRNAYAGYGGWYYPNAEAMDIWPERLEYIPGTALYVGIDPGDADDTALHWVMCDGAGGYDAVLESYERSGPPPEHYGAIILGCDPDVVEAAYPALRFSALDRELMAWTRTLPQPTLCGDPAGKQKHAGDSWYDKLQRFAVAHNPRKSAVTGNGQPLAILINYQNDARYDQGRRIATMNWLPRIRWNDTPEVRRTLHAIKRSRFEPDDKPRMAEQKRPLHDALSHRRTALEFVAVNLDVARGIRGRDGSYDGGKGARDTIARRAG